MYDLSHQIEYLLLGHDCVVMPGFGAFINVHHAASFDSHKNIWKAPYREIRFNKALSYDDGLLANSYARKNSVSFEQGRELMRRDIDNLQRELTLQGEVTLGNLGILSKNDYTVTFIPLISASRLTRMLGFYDASINSNPTGSSREKENIKDITSDYATNSKSFIDNNIRITKNERFDITRNYYIAINKTFAKVAACFIILAVTALAVILPLQSMKQVDKASVVPVERIIEGIGAKTAVSPPELIEEANIIKETTDRDNLNNEKSPSTQVQQKKFHAIVATFASEKEAEKFILQYHERGMFKLHVINTPTKSRVSAADSENREELMATMRSPEFQTYFKEAWIWEYQDPID